MAGAGLKATGVNQDFTGFRAQQLQQAQQQQQLQKQQQEQEQQQKQQQKQNQQQRRFNPRGWGRRGWAMLRNVKSTIARREAPFDEEYAKFTDDEDKDPEAPVGAEPDYSSHPVYRHNQFGITPAPNNWPVHLDDYHSPVKPLTLTLSLSLSLSLGLSLGLTLSLTLTVTLTVTLTLTLTLTLKP